MSGAEEHESDGRGRAALRALRDVFASPALRRLQLAWVGSILGGWAYLVALGVYAYGQGGASGGRPGRPDPPRARRARGAVHGLARRPLLARRRDGRERPASASRSCWRPRRRSRRTGLRRSSTRLVALSTIAGTVFRPAQAALLPALVRSPSELTAANVASSTLESVGTFLGPALGGLLLAVSSPEVVFAANGASFLWSAFLVARPPALRAAARAGGVWPRAQQRSPERDPDDRRGADPADARRPLRGADARRRRAQRARRRHLVRAARARRGGGRPALRRGRRRWPRGRVRGARCSRPAGGWRETSPSASRSSGCRSR